MRPMIIAAFLSLAMMANASNQILSYDLRSRKTSQITALAGQEAYNPSGSPDGKFVVSDYTVLGNSVGLMVTNIRSHESYPLQGGEGGNDASYSPNGKWIVFDREPFQDQSIYIVPAGGGTPIRMRENAQYARWSPDGKYLVFEDVTGGGYPAIRTVEISSGDSTLVSAQGKAPIWSPDGKKIAFYRSTFGTYPELADNLFVVAVDCRGNPKGQETQLTFDNYSVFNQYASWSRDSKWLVFHSNREGTSGLNDYDIFAIKARGGAPVRVTGSPNGGDYNPSFSPNGRYIFYSGPVDE